MRPQDDLAYAPPTVTVAPPAQSGRRAGWGRRAWAAVATPEGLILGQLTLLALLLRGYCLDCTSLWRDEVAILEGLRGGLSAVRASNVPLYSFIVWVSTQIVDPTTSSVLLRLPSALAGALLPLAVYALGRELFGRLAGLTAALLATFAPVLLVYSQEMRSYAVLTLLTTLAVYCLLRAERTPALGWGVAFLVVMAANLLYSRTVLVVVLPTLAPYGLWVLWRLGRRRLARRRLLLVGGLGLGALLLLGAVALAVRGDLLRYITPFTLPDLSQFNLSTLWTVGSRQIVFFTPFGLDADGESALRILLSGLAFAGLVGGWRQGQRRGVVWCVGLLGIPIGLLALSSTANVLYPRFALFAVVFYFLLVGNGVAVLVAPLLSDWGLRLLRLVAGLGAGVLLIAAVLPMIVGAYIYQTPAGNAQMAYRPDYRGANRYLAQAAQPADVIIFVGWDSRVSDFYWKNRPPAPAYSALDPRLFRTSGPGAIYWVVSYDDFLPLDTIHIRSWAAVRYFERIVVLKESSAQRDLRRQMADMTGALLFAAPLDPVIARAALIMQGGVAEARGQVATAVAGYRAVGADAPTRAFGMQWLQTAQDDLDAGDMPGAWRAALMSKFHQPDEPQVYGWIATQLTASGYTAEGQTEQQVIAALGR